MPQNSQKKKTPNKKVSYAIAVITGTLQTDYAQKAYARHYQRVGGALYQITVLGRKKGANIINDSAIDELEEQITLAMDGLLEEMENGIDEMKAEAGDKIDRIRIEYVSPLDVEFKNSTQLQKKHMDLIEKLDEVIRCIDQMTLLGLKETRDQVNESFKWRRSLESTSARIISVANEFGGRLNEAIEENNKKTKKKTKPIATSKPNAAPKDTEKKKAKTETKAKKPKKVKEPSTAEAAA